MWLPVLVLLSLGQTAWGSSGRLKVNVVDSESQQPLTARMYLTNSRGKTILARGATHHADYFIVPGEIVLRLPPDTYEFRLEKGLEYRSLRGHFVMERKSEDEQTLEMHRIVDLRKEGWWSGDLVVRHAPTILPRLMAAEDLQLACAMPETLAADAGSLPETQPSAEGQPSPPWIVSRNQLAWHAGGDFALLGLRPPTQPSSPPPPESPTSPSTIQLLTDLRTNGAPRCTVALRPYAWDLPSWLVRGEIDGICLLHGNHRAANSRDDEDHGYPRDRVLFPAPLGNGRWSQHIYWQVLNLGSRIPPVAASESGFSPNPVGYNRVYVHCEANPTQEQWWENLRLGRVFVTNGPLLRVQFNGEYSGHVFSAAAGESVSIEASADLATREKIEYLQIIQNGEVVHDVRLESLIDRRGKLPPVVFTSSGWLAVRAATTSAETYQAALTGPIYVQIGDQRPSPTADPDFWVTWVTKRSQALLRLHAADWPGLQSTYRQTRDFFAKLSATSAGTP